MNNLLRKKTNELAMKKKKGFTLVELIIVIAIIAILAAIAIPKFGAIKKNSNVAADQANAKIIATAVASAVANGDLADADDASLDDTALAKITPYIDGGSMPKAKIGTFTVSYTKAGGVIVTTSEGRMYPVS